jgi:hypothetical protein
MADFLVLCRFFNELTKVLNDAYQQCRQEGQQQAFKQLMEQPQKLNECFDNHLKSFQTLIDCVNQKSQQHGSCTQGAQKGAEIANIPASEMLAYFIAQIGQRTDAQIKKMAKAGGKNAFGQAFQSQIRQCMRDHVTDKMTTQMKNADTYK